MRYGASPEGREERAGGQESFRSVPDHRVEVATTFSEVLLNLASIYLLTSQRSLRYSYVVAKGSAPSKTDVLQGTLDLMVLQTLDTMGPLHGYGIARRIEQISDAVLTLNEGTVYASLMRLQQQGWISASWGISDNNRKAKSTPSREAVVGS